MRILFVITGLGVGGAEKIVTSLADELANQGHDLVIAYLRGEAIVTPKNHNIKLVSLDLNSPKNVLSSSFRLRKLIKTFKPDVVHSHLVHANIISRLIRLTTPVPKLITSAHNTNEEGQLRILAYRLTDKLATVSTNVSQEAVDAFIDQKAVKKGRMLALYNSISTSEFSFSQEQRDSIRKELKVDTNTQLILAVGRLNEQKDYPNLLIALSEITKSNSKFKLAIAGDGPLLQDLKNLTHKLGLDDKVLFLGVRNDIPALMSAADVFVLSSAWEGFGLVVAEAMSCERVVVATDCGGVREVVGDAGLLVPPKDSLKLANSIKKALNLNDSDKKELGEKARQRIIDNYSISSAVQKWLILYKMPNKLLNNASYMEKVKL